MMSTKLTYGKWIRIDQYSSWNISKFGKNNHIPTRKPIIIPELACTLNYMP
ncbi:hypothetical protein Gotri_017922 [Gossypium trilobum]|uniref:Uncharacterized protein n=1 Tax=Gossypium trilobum TaxID=34281 RepID=A0A7J9E7Y8_9ROSI|nr:hypothetical protein [Gossypium trilobum]